MESFEDIEVLTAQAVPSILSFDREKQCYVIGYEAREFGVKGQTNIFNFKPSLSLTPAKFANDKKFWIRVDMNDRMARTFSAKEATKIYLSTLLDQLPEHPDQLIVGEPTMRDPGWGERFRSHVRQIFSDLGLPEPQFFAEPFAVFQYYRHVVGAIPKTDVPQTILVIDFGGGTFDICVVRTTKTGDLARGGSTARPLGIQSKMIAGRDIDQALLKKVVEYAEQQKIVFKDDPLKRAAASRIPAFFLAEDVKLRLSKKLEGYAFNANLTSIREPIVVPKGVLHPEHEIYAELTGEDLKYVINAAWRRDLGDVVLQSINEAGKSLGEEISRLDKILVAGGSAKLPFLMDLIHTTVPTLLRGKEDIIIAKDSGKAVAWGIAIECRERNPRYPDLASDKIAPCIQNDLYLYFGRSRKEVPRPGVVKGKEPSVSKGCLLSGPLISDDLTFDYSIGIPFNPEERLFYWFSDRPVAKDAIMNRINLTDDVLRVPRGASRKLKMELKVSKDGMIQPIFSFLVNRPGKKAEREQAPCPPFFFDSLKITEGKRYFGLDFGTSNSYAVQILDPLNRQIEGIAYPERLRVRDETLRKLRRVEVKITQLREQGRLKTETIEKDAHDSSLSFVFHSNKIEDSSLTIGETKEVWNSPRASIASPQQLAARNTKDAYEWMVENKKAILEQPESAIRHMNQMVIRGLSESGGKYRSGNIEISGTNYVPPPPFSVPNLMQQLASELKTQTSNRAALEIAAAAHTKLVLIHPFEDGNGRTARLLLNAILLAYDLPLVVINFDERNRYIDALLETDKGELSSLLELLLECLEISLSRLDKTEEKVDSDESISDSTQSDSQTGFNLDVAVGADQIRNALLEIESRNSSDHATFEESLISPEDMLSQVMEEKLREEKARYDAWSRAYDSIARYVDARRSAFNQEYARHGYSIGYRLYDALSFDKYKSLANGQRVVKTWFFGLQIKSRITEEKLIFFFQTASFQARQVTNASPVSLTLSRHDGTSYRRLVSEPIRLREIAYAGGNLVPLGVNELRLTSTMEETLTNTIAEIIRAYF